MLLTIANIAFFLIAVAMIALILMQRGQGATAGSGFGAGASATVFGARGSANFLSRSTAVLAAAFMLVSLGMAVYASRNAAPGTDEDLGIMGRMEAPAQPVQAPVQFQVPAAPAPASEVPAVPAANQAPVEPAAEADDEGPVER